MVDSVLFSSKSNEHCTPPPLFRALDKEFHFELDAAATPQNALCPYYLTAEMDGTRTDWSYYGKSVFCNPPYGKDVHGKSLITAFVYQAHMQTLRGVTSVFLVPARTDTKWFWDWCYCRGTTELSKADEVRLIEGRLKFFIDGEVERDSAPFPSMLVIFRPYDQRTNLTPGFLPFKPYRWK